MNRIALIKNGVVENIIVSTLDFALTLGYETAVDVTALFQDEDPVNPERGWTYAEGVFAPPPAPPVLTWANVTDPRYHWIDPGPFRSRLGMDRHAIAASDHKACKAAKADLEGREYVDLMGAEVAQGLDLLIATGQPAADPAFPGSGPMTLEKKAAILNPITTDYERHIKGLPQPILPEE